MTRGHSFDTAFGGVFLEGLEVVFIVVVLRRLNSLQASTIGALLSLVFVIAAGIAVRLPLTRVPENTVNYTVGVMLTSFSTFFVGEGSGVVWWHDDLVRLPLIAGYAVASLVFVQYFRRRPTVAADQVLVLRWHAPERSRSGACS
jgi:Ca2+/H+ antiporter, TMEM165/GDT1 family